MNAKTDWTLKNVKNFEGMEGYGFNASLYHGTKRIAKVIDDASGGEIMFYWEGKTRAARDANEAMFGAYVATLPPHQFEGTLLKVTMGMAVADMLVVIEENKILKRHCRTKIVFRLVGDDGENGAWRTLRGTFTKAHVDEMHKRYGTKLGEIANYRFGDPA